MHRRFRRPDKEESLEAMKPISLATKSKIVADLQSNPDKNGPSPLQESSSSSDNKAWISHIGVQLWNPGEGSAQPAEPHHTPVDPLPSTSLPPIPIPSPTNHSTSSKSPPHHPHQITTESFTSEEDISPTILEAAKTLSKVASQGVSKVKSTDKGKRYMRRARSVAKNINTGLDAEKEINTGREEINIGIKSYKLEPKRMVEEEALSEQQEKRKAQVQFEAQYYTEEDWDAIRANRYCESKKGNTLSEERAKAKRNKPRPSSQLRIYMSKLSDESKTVKLSQLKKLSFEEIKEEFDKCSAIGEKVVEVKEEEPVKRTGKRKKQKARKGISVDKRYIMRIHRQDKEETLEAMNPTSLATKSNIVVNWKIFEQELSKGENSLQAEGLDLFSKSIQHTSSLLINPVAMISMRLKKFYKKTGRKLQFDAKKPVGFDKTKVECFNCHKTEYFARRADQRESHIRRRDHLFKAQTLSEQVQENELCMIEALMSVPFDLTPSDNEDAPEQCAKVVSAPNSFVPTAVLIRTGRFPVNTARHNFNSQAVSTSAARKVNTARPIVNDIRPRNNFYKGTKQLNDVGGIRETAIKPSAALLFLEEVKMCDRKNRFSWVFFLRTKDETSGILKDFIRQIENQLNQKVKTIRCDNGTEFKNRDIIEFCGSKGIKREYSNARTPQQNGVAERKNRTLIEAARTMLADSFLPNTFWAEAVSTACYVLNRVLVTKPQNKTPYELITGKIPIISYIRPFGCHVTILNTIDHLGKFEEKSDEGFLVGYSLNSKAFRVYNLETKRVEENLHINFLENKPNVAGKGPTWLFDLDYLTDSMNYQPVTAENKANKTAGPKEANNSAGTQDNNDAGNSKMEAEPAQEYFVLPLWSSYTSTIKSSEAKNGGEKPNGDIGSKTNEEPVDQAHQDLLLQAGAARASSTNYVNTASTPVNTASPLGNVRAARLSYPDPSKYANQDDSQIPGLEDIYEVLSEGIFTSASYKDEGAVTDFTNLETIMNIKPKKISQALEDESWVDAIQEELLQFKIQKVWILVDLPLGKKAIGTKWDKYVAEILKKFDFMSVKTASTLIETQKPLVKDEEAADVDVHLYRSMIGSLMYLTTSRPDIMFAVCACSRVSAFDLEAYSDSEYASVNLDRKSTTGGCQFLEAREHFHLAVQEEETLGGYFYYKGRIPHDSPLSGGHTSDRAEGGLNLEELYVLCTNLLNKVLTLETSNGAQAAEILKLKTRIKKLEKKCQPVISHHRAWLRRGKNTKSGPKLDDSGFDDLDADLAHGMDDMETEEAVNEGRQSNETEELNLDANTEVIAEDKGSGKKGGSIVSTARPNIGTARQEISNADPTTPLTTTTIFDDEEMTLADTLVMIKDNKAKGVVFKDTKELVRPTRSVLTLKPLPSIDPKDKGKGV
ncbi:ribonuclease H-like domain-containing protein [Tanacetum coccineum]